ncbi:MAG: S8 family peptidase [Bdellovibrionota bacterium]
MIVSFLFYSVFFGVQALEPASGSSSNPSSNLQVTSRDFDQDQSWIIELKDKSILERQLQNKKEGRALESPQALKNQLSQSQNQFIHRMKNRIGQISIKRKLHTLINAVVLHNLSEEQIKELQSLNEVSRISPNAEVNIQLHENLSLIRVPELWQHSIATPELSEFGSKSPKTSLMGKGIRVGIIDTGIDYLHPSLGGCLGAHCKVKGGWNFVSNNSNVIDDQGHGTHVAGIVAGKGYAQNGTPIFGVAPEADLYAIKVLNSIGNGTWDDILAGVEWSLDPNQDGDFSDRLDIINLSLGGITGEPDSPLARAIDHLTEEGMVVVIAAGNNGPSPETVLHPGNSRHAITVAASNKRDQLANFSSRGPVVWRDSQGHLNTLLKPDITAPGVLICAPRAAQAIAAYSNFCEDENHVRLSGTSMATPMVAGVVALMLQKNPELKPYQVKRALQSSVMNLLDEENLPLWHGRGFINATQAVFSKPAPNLSLGAIKKIGTQMELELKGDFDEIELSYAAYASFQTAEPIDFISLSSVIAEDPQNQAVRFTYPEGEDFILQIEISRAGFKKSKAYHYFVDRYSLCSLSDFQPLERKARADYKLICDLEINFPEVFQVGDFNGSLDGQFHSIRFNWSEPWQRYYTSFFSTLEKDSVVENLHFENVRVFSPGPIAWLTHELRGHVKNLSIEGLIESNASAAAVALDLRPGAKIENTKFTGWIDANHVVGGLVAFSHGNSQILNSSVQGDLLGSEILGGLVGHNFSSEFEILNSFASVNMSNANSLGGVVGSSDQNFFMTEVFWNSQSSKVEEACANIFCDGAASTTNEGMMNPLTFQSWDFENIWAMVPFESEPFFLWESAL